MATKRRNRDFGKNIAHKLDAGQPVQVDLEGGSQIRIERAQPFICLYRPSPGDVDVQVRELLTTQASYLVIEEEDFDPTELKGLIGEILAYLGNLYGNALVIEVWADEGGETDPEIDLYLPRITVHTQAQDAPIESIEELERVLIGSSWIHSRGPELSVVYERNPGPQNMGPLVPKFLADSGIGKQIGLEICSFYRSPQGGELLPQVYAELRKNLAQAIRRAVYAFVDEHGNYSPTHYHEFGPSKIENLDTRVDAELVRIDDALSLLLNVTPVNTEQAWHQFQKNRFASMPEFHYRALTFDPAKMKRELFSIEVESVEDPALHAIFDTKRIELDRQLTMLTDRGSGTFLLESQQIYGGGESETIGSAIEILEQVPPHTHDDRASHYLDAEDFAAKANEEIAYYSEKDPEITSKVTIRPDIPGLMVSRGNFLVSSGARVPEHRVEATLQHEIGTHALTYHNGGCQPLKLLQAGLAGYEELQEGIAVLSEFLVGGLSRPRIRQVAGRVVAVSQLVEGAEFVEVFRSMHDDFGFNQTTAFNITMRVFRGGGFTKDTIYMRGLIRVMEYLQAGGKLEPLLLGKIALEHVDITTELLWRKILKTPRVVPRYLENTQALVRLDKIEGCENVMGLLTEQLL